MAGIRHPFGGGVADWAAEPNGSNIPVLTGGSVLRFYSDREAGSEYTNLTTDQAGTTPAGTVLSSSGGDGYDIGQVPVIFGPVDVTTMWMSADGGTRVALQALDGADQGVQAQISLSTHLGQANGHGTGAGDLVDVELPAAGTRVPGTVLGVDADGTTIVPLTPAQQSGAVLLNPPLSGGSYVGNVATPPLSSQGQSGEPWLQLQQPYSAADDNPDAIQLFSTTSGGTKIKTGWSNGNNEGRDAPSTTGRVARRVFEFYESLGGPSTNRFFECSTNPSNPANREALLGVYGTGHSTQPGWVEATRVLSGKLGVQAGGSYNSLSALNWRGRRGSTGAPTTGTWATGDVVMDSAGAVYLCTAGGTPGTWSTGTAAAAPTSFVAITPGADMGHGAKTAASRLDRGGDNGRLRGILTATGSVSSGAVIATIPTTAHRPLATAITIARYSGGGMKFTINTDGTINNGSTLTVGQEIWLDGITWDMLA